jgi:hypothetical protein
MERTRKRLNRGLRTYLLQNNSYAIAHPYFDDSYSALYDDDGVHLSFIGKDIFINTIQEALFQFLRYPNCNYKLLGPTREAKLINFAKLAW